MINDAKCAKSKVPTAFDNLIVLLSSMCIIACWTALLEPNALILISVQFRLVVCVYMCSSLTVHHLPGETCKCSNSSTQIWQYSMIDKFRQMLYRQATTLNDAMNPVNFRPPYKHHTLEQHHLHTSVG